MTNPDQTAAQIRSTLPTIEHAMAIIGIKPPNEWQQLKELVAAPPSDALTKAAQGWAEVKTLIEQGSNEFDQQSAAVPAVWDSDAGTATVASLAALSKRQQALSASCDDVIANLHAVIKAFVTFLLMILAILVTAVAGALFIIATFWAAPVASTLFAVVGIIVAIYGINHEVNVFRTTVSNRCHNLDALTTQL